MASNQPSRSMDDLIDTAYVVCGIDRRQVGFAYRIWSSNTSFYIKPLIPGFEGIKISLHGRDPRPGMVPMFKAETNDGGRGFIDEVNTEQSVGYTLGDWPVIFPGKALPNGGRLVVRTRWTWDSCFRPRMAPFAPRKDLRAKEVGLIAAAPSQPGVAADLDLVHSEDAPKWESRLDTKRDNAWVGPFRNRSGDYLTGAFIHRKMFQYPNPAASELHRPTAADEIRGMWCGVDDDGVLWLIQQRQSGASLREAASRSHSEE